MKPINELQLNILGILAQLERGYYSVNVKVKRFQRKKVSLKGESKREITEKGKKAV